MVDSAGRRSTYAIDRSVLGFEDELKRLEAQARMGWEREFRFMQLFGLQDGMRILEAGCGPGFVTERISDALPDARITALDFDEKLVMKARERLASRYPNVHFVHASVYDTGLPDDRFDLAFARMLFLHLYQPEEAAAELRRVLKPGGKLIITDIDDGVFGAVQPDFAELPDLLRRIADRAAAGGGNRRIGRMLPKLLVDSGFTAIELEAVVQHSSLHGREGFMLQFDPRRFAGLRDHGIITAEQFDRIEQMAARISKDPEASAMMMYFMASGTKPA